MARNVSWRRTLSDTASWRQDQGLQAAIFIVREVGPTGFLLKEEGESKPFKVLLGDPHSCTCSVLRSSHEELCKHICWLLLKKFRLLREEPISWQLGLVENEINALLHGVQSRQQSIRNRPETPRKPSNSALNKDGRPVLQQREISEEDTCPICMEELLLKREPVTYCKYSCANSIHIKCMKIWADHQISAKEAVKCPFCREDFGPAEYLREEYKNSVGRMHPSARLRPARHSGTRCRVCNESPIQGKCYRCCRCNEFHLCQRCFNTSAHESHSFEYRAEPIQRWRPAQRVDTNGLPIPAAVVNSLINRDIGDRDYDLLLQLDNSDGAALSEIPEAVIKKFRLERVRIGSRYLAPGEQCCICLRSYQAGDFIRALPCRHKFHRDCIDNWLLHQHPTCPVDGQTVWSRHSAADVEPANHRPQRIRQQNRNTRPNQLPTHNSNGESALEIPGIGIGRRETQSANLDTTQVVTGLRRVQSGGSIGTASRTSGNFDPGNDVTVSLAQLLLTDAIESQDGGSDLLSDDVSAERVYIRSQISHTRSPDNALANHVSGNRAGTVSSHVNLSHVGHNTRSHVVVPGGGGGASVSDTESENARRRRRNLALASRARSTNELTSAPSINTAQPRGASSLYLGNPVIDNERISEQPMARMRNAHRQNGQHLRSQFPEAHRELNQLHIGSDSRETNLLRPGVTNNRTANLRAQNARRNNARLATAHQPTIALLELSGIRLDN